MLKKFPFGDTILKDLGIISQDRGGRFWYEVGQMKLFDGELRLPLLVRVMSGLMSIPASNADSERRGFSMLRKVHTDQRLSQRQSTIIYLMTIKFNSEECCHDSICSEELLTKCKKATVLHNKKIKFIYSINEGVVGVWLC